MIKVNKQIKTGNSTILLLDSEIPHIRFSKLLIDGEEYKPGKIRKQAGGYIWKLKESEVV